MPVICSLSTLIIHILYAESNAKKNFIDALDSHRSVLMKTTNSKITNRQSPIADRITTYYWICVWKRENIILIGMEMRKYSDPLCLYAFMYSFLWLVLFSLFFTLRRFILLPCTWKVDELKRKETKMKNKEEKIIDRCAHFATVRCAIIDETTQIGHWNRMHSSFAFWTSYHDINVKAYSTLRNEDATILKKSKKKPTIKKKKKHYKKILLRPNIDFSISLHIQQSVSIITSHRGDSECMFNSIRVSARDVCINE